MSTQIISVLVLFASQLLPYIGVTVDSKELESSIQTIVALVTGVIIWIQRTRLQKAPMGRGDVSAYGTRIERIEN